MTRCSGGGVEQLKLSPIGISYERAARKGLVSDNQCVAKLSPGAHNVCLLPRISVQHQLPRLHPFKDFHVRKFTMTIALSWLNGTSICVY